MNNLTEKERKAIEELLEGLKKVYGSNLSKVIQEEMTNLIPI